MNRRAIVFTAAGLAVILVVVTTLLFLTVHIAWSKKSVYAIDRRAHPVHWKVEYNWPMRTFPRFFSKLLIRYASWRDYDPVMIGDDWSVFSLPMKCG
jgi:hypothetical protein